MIVFRQTDPRYPFLWSDAAQPAARWHGEGEGPAHYFADTPDGAWAELLRHEEITDPEDVATLNRALWAVEIGDDRPKPVSLPTAVSTGDLESYAACQAHARRLRARGARRLVAPSAALAAGGATGRRIVDSREQPGLRQDGRVIILFGDPARLIGWQVVERGAPPPDVVSRVRHVAR
ncbi:MAG TPA: RES domain-containing protein [Vicinamibacterales bacterium]|nr:RES domain-containing protein [Vicinamibacterales bacterium]